MTLQFPNIRLYIANQLLEDRLDCTNVMVKTAYDLGLVPQDSLDDMSTADDGVVCGSMLAARRIIEKYLESQSIKGNGASQAEISETVWSQFAKEVESYKLKTDLNHTRLPDGHARALECGRMAPVVFDLLLQHLQRY